MVNYKNVQVINAFLSFTIIFKGQFYYKINKNYINNRIYTYIYIPHQLHIQTLYIIQNKVFTMDIKHFSNGQLSRKTVQLIYVDCPRIMQTYFVYRISMGLFH